LVSFIPLNYRQFSYFARNSSKCLDWFYFDWILILKRQDFIGTPVDLIASINNAVAVYLHQ